MINWSTVPAIRTLASLDQNWRRVANQIDYGKWEWLGDLAHADMFAIYKHMLNNQRVVNQVMRSTGEGCSTLFAQMRPSHDAQECIEHYNRMMRQWTSATVQDVRRRNYERVR